MTLLHTPFKNEKCFSAHKLHKNSCEWSFVDRWSILIPEKMHAMATTDLTEEWKAAIKIRWPKWLMKKHILTCSYHWCNEEGMQVSPALHLTFCGIAWEPRHTLLPLSYFTEGARLQTEPTSLWAPSHWWQASHWGQEAIILSSSPPTL